MMMRSESFRSCTGGANSLHFALSIRYSSNPLIVRKRLTRSKAATCLELNAKWLRQLDGVRLLQ